MKKIVLSAFILVTSLSLTACNTWSGVKEDAKAVGHATGDGLEKAGEKIKDIAK